MVEKKKIEQLYALLKERHGAKADPATWWPIFYGRIVPPEFERLITNILVQNSNWKAVPAAVEALKTKELLQASAIAKAPVEQIAACIRPTGLQLQKAGRLRNICAQVVEEFGSEAIFCRNVTRAQLLRMEGIGEPTADRTLLYVCGRLEWPVDAYCLRVLAHYGVLESLPRTSHARERCALEIKQLVHRAMPRMLEDWQRLHALMQLEGTILPVGQHS